MGFSTEHSTIVTGYALKFNLHHFILPSPFSRVGFTFVLFTTLTIPMTYKILERPYRDIQK